METLKSWDTFKYIWAEWLSLGLSTKSNDTFLASFNFSDKEVTFSHKAGMESFMWITTPGL
jgi:hypothetical protein